MNYLSKTLFIIYVIVLLWLVLFKLSFDVFWTRDIQNRSLNLIPFLYSPTGSLQHHLIEILVNIIAFIPFSFLLSHSFKKRSYRYKLMVVLSLSLVVEAVQFVFAIGVADITDIIANTLGGVIGL